MRLPACLPVCLSSVALSFTALSFTALSFTALSFIAIALCAAGCASAPTGSVAETPVYVLNLQNSERGRAEQRPASLVLSEFSTMSGVTWRTWGPTRATGAGKISGTWCLPECADAPYVATVTLSSVIPVKGKGYFSRYAVTADVPVRQRPEADLTGVLPTP